MTEQEDSHSALHRNDPPQSARSHGPSLTVRSQDVIPILNQQKEHSIFARKVRLPATYANPTREKLFACMHCTMKFAKAINLYKHLKVSATKTQFKTRNRDDAQIMTSVAAPEPT